MITPGPPDSDPEGWVTLAQLEANRERVIFRSLGPGPGRIPGRRAGDGPQGDRRRGLGADRGRAATHPACPRPWPRPSRSRSPWSSSAGRSPRRRALPVHERRARRRSSLGRELVQAALEDAKKAGLPADGTALILVDRTAEALLGRSGRRAGGRRHQGGAQGPAGRVRPARRIALGRRGHQDDRRRLPTSRSSWPRMRRPCNWRPRLGGRSRRVGKSFVAGYANHSNAIDARRLRGRIRLRRIPERGPGTARRPGGPGPTPRRAAGPQG